MALMSAFNYGHPLVASTSMTIAIASLSPANSTLTNCGGHEEKVRNVRQRLVKLRSGNALKELIMIDNIQRLGIDHLFSDEIREGMERQYTEWYSGGRNHKQDELHEVALRFRLLRQQGYYVPSDVFKQFRNRKGEFEEGVSSNIEGLMGLFEASQMSIAGEDILDQANAFTSQLLQHLDRNKPRHANKYDAAINTALRLPYHKSLSKFTAMELLQSTTEHNSEGRLLELRELAKLDFDMAATSYKHEFLHFSRWWKEIGVAEDLEFARDEPVEWYSWGIGSLTHPKLWEERLEVAKPIALVYVVDDLFDVYGDINHLSLFTQAINSWELAAVEELPEYMRSTWRVIFDTTNDISHKIWMKHGWNPNTYLHKAWADFCNACLTEAKWNASGYSPTTLEYLKIRTVTSGGPLILRHAFFLLVETLNSETVQLLNDDPRIISSVATITRLSNDFIAKDEGQNGYDGSYVKWYMKENDGISMEETRGRVDGMISEAWKELNKECLHLPPHPFSSTNSFGRACLNSARTAHLMYGYEDGDLPGPDKFLMLMLNGSS